MENSIFVQFEKTLQTAFVNVRSGNELLYIDVDLSKALFWNFQENMRDLVCECERFGLATSQMFPLAARQHDLVLLVSNAKDKAQINFTQLSGEELEQHVINALGALEYIELQFMDLMKVVGDEYGFKKFSAKA
ncbi:TPA: hypothetical protein NGV38_005196 [Vibrio parahaemolyticus]|uniref:hypothetical protein n=1 Tax=Vibrio parahaemolyticus TaxID=670 RepID=UPI000402AD60|nr:hypothetical protein [Vibrio parahaemolyticus]EGQ7919792.1 hypothetical protein [Vibrio parahaemolyticus]EGQ9942639.1 hypothetical protein [Vibrio parahaemolyticus]EGR3235706.1 hypothetical protein [Vibrio parahaemolyticus]ELA6920842.1 hypothetical protein [Vibrio parahaemolyticus]ELB2059893.1 hypothetical protein [Vibrio parahaemolyticus]